MGDCQIIIWNFVRKRVSEEDQWKAKTQDTKQFKEQQRSYCYCKDVPLINTIIPDSNIKYNMVCLAADSMRGLKSLCFLVPRNDFLKLFVHCIMHCLTGEKSLIYNIQLMSKMKFKFLNFNLKNNSNIAY